jgi:homoaconitate hydratase
MTMTPGVRFFRHQVYAKVLELDLSSLGRYVAGPNEVARLVPLATLQRERIPVHKAYIVSCVNSRTQVGCDVM